ncbi:acetolactate decarboxylase, partial [Vibrio sp. 10N.286.49.E1]
PDTIFNVTKVSSKEKFVELFQQRFNNDNLFQALRIDGDFKAIQFRSIVKDADNSERNLKKYIEKNQIIND